MVVPDHGDELYGGGHVSWGSARGIVVIVVRVTLVLKRARGMAMFVETSA